MIINKKDNDRFSKVIKKLSNTSEQVDTSIKIASTHHSSFLQDISVRSDKSNKTTQVFSHQDQTVSQTTAIKLLLEDYHVIINRQNVKLKVQFVPTSNGMRYIMTINQIFINLSWLHSVQELQKTKILLLYYDLRDIVKGKRPKLQSLVIELGRPSQKSGLFLALTYVHGKWHDEEVQKLYHFLC